MASPKLPHLDALDQALRSRIVLLRRAMRSDALARAVCSGLSYDSLSDDDKYAFHDRANGVRKWWRTTSEDRQSHELALNALKAGESLSVVDEAGEGSAPFICTQWSPRTCRVLHWLSGEDSLAISALYGAAVHEAAALNYAPFVADLLQRAWQAYEQLLSGSDVRHSFDPRREAFESVGKALVELDGFLFDIDPERAVGLIDEAIAPEIADPEFRPWSWFQHYTTITSDTLRNATKANRKTLRVRKSGSGKAVKYSARDAREHWPERFLDSP